MRITGGALKGRLIKCPEGIIRPAMDKMRESLFSILGDFSGKSWLDLFSGSGTIALEAASRGAGRIELCEKDKIKVNTILENVFLTEKELGIKIQCHFMPVEYFIKRSKSKFDYIFFDPPFPYKYHEQIIEETDKKKLLETEGTILIHRPKEHFMPDSIGELNRTDCRIYGRSVVDFYKY